jgi:uncharacterized membrane-anchored protein YitT (DUF2179 family)
MIVVVVKKGVVILIGSAFLAIGINFFLIPFYLLDGGIIGIGLIINYLTGLKAGLMIILCSIPVFLLAWFRYRSYFFNSLQGMLVSSFLIDVFYPHQFIFLYYVKLSPVWSAIIGGFFVGLGIGIMLKFETSTGGTDLLAQFLSNAFQVNVGVMIFIIDAVVICLGGLLISSETFFLSIITISVVGITTSLCTWKRVKV